MLGEIVTAVTTSAMGVSGRFVVVRSEAAELSHNVFALRRPLVAYVTGSVLYYPYHSELLFSSGAIVAIFGRSS